jgi:tellurite resistance protein TehA-like permease
MDVTIQISAALLLAGSLASLIQYPHVFFRALELQFIELCLLTGLAIVALPVSLATSERAWTSPIWYEPKG